MLYAPNEEELKVATLTTLYNDLKTNNDQVVAATVALSNNRIVRNEMFYRENTGLVAITVDIKAYVKSIYGASSPQYKQISKLAFKTVKM